MLRLKTFDEVDEKYKQWRAEDYPFIPKFEWKVDKVPLFNTIKRFIYKGSVIVHACDAETEGQLIGDEIIKYSRVNKPVKRLWTSSLTPKAIQDAVRNMKDNSFYKPLYLQGLARQHADYLIGLNLTRVVSSIFRQNGVYGTFPIGRIKTALLSMIYDRELHIETFKAQPFWDVTATFKVNESVFERKWFNDKQEHILFKQQALDLSTVLKGGNCYVLWKEITVNNQRPPQLYNLSSLMIKANNQFKYSPKTVTSIAQSLYEKGFISYPRTSSVCVTEEEANGISRDS